MSPIGRPPYSRLTSAGTGTRCGAARHDRWTSDDAREQHSRRGQGPVRTSVRADGLVVLHVLEAIEGGTARHLVDVVTHARGVRHVVAIPAQRVGGLTDRTARSALEGRGSGGRHLVGMRRNPGHPANLASLAPLLKLAPGRPI